MARTHSSFRRIAGPTLIVAPFAAIALCCAACSSDPGSGPAGADDASARESGPVPTLDAGPESGDARAEGAPAEAGVVPTGDGGTRIDAGDAAIAPVDAATGDGGPNNPPNPFGRGPAPVNLGSPTNLATAGSYVLLAKTGITNVTGSLITGGHLGLSPAAASFITGFSLVADSTNVFSTSASVAAPWKVFASDYAVPTPANLTSAILGMQNAYTDAAGRTNPDGLDLSGGDIGGLTFAPGLYTWGSGVTIPTDVTLSGGANDVWIFQMTDNLDLSAATHVVLTGGAQARNVFWQVAGDVTIHATAHFEGIIVCQTAITLQTTASMHGRALAQSLIALDNNAVTAP